MSHLLVHQETSTHYAGNQLSSIQGKNMWTLKINALCFQFHTRALSLSWFIMTWKTKFGILKERMLNSLCSLIPTSLPEIFISKISPTTLKCLILRTKIGQFFFPLREKTIECQIVKNHVKLSKSKGALIEKL